MSHVTEHLTDDAAQRVFNDAFRVMKSGGVFRITCPDADSAFDALVAGRRDFFRVYDENVIFNDPAWALKYKLICPLKHQDIEQLFLYLICTQRCGAVDLGKNKISNKHLGDIIQSDLSRDEIFDSICGNIDLRIQEADPWMHLNWWTVGKLKRFLTAAGFDQVYVSGYQKSFVSEFKDVKFFDLALPEISLYVEAIK
jgi:hypothetical protein